MLDFLLLLDASTLVCSGTSSYCGGLRKVVHEAPKRWQVAGQGSVSQAVAVYGTWPAKAAKPSHRFVIGKGPINHRR